MMCSAAHPTKSSKITQNVFIAIGGLHEDKLCDTLQELAATNVKKSSNLLSPYYREQPRPARIVVVYRMGDHTCRACLLLLFSFVS